MYLSLSYVYAYRLLGMVSMLAKYSIEGQILSHIVRPFTKIRDRKVQFWRLSIVDNIVMIEI